MILSGDYKHSAKVWFYQLGLGDANTVNDLGWKLETLGSIMTKLRHSDVSLACVTSAVRLVEMYMLLVDCSV